jgi:hypothetical protein
MRHSDLPLERLIELNNYVEHHAPLTSEFCKALVLNDFLGMMSQSNTEDMRYLIDYALYMYDNVPRQARGSQVAVDRWLQGVEIADDFIQNRFIRCN